MGAIQMQTDKKDTYSVLNVSMAIAMIDLLSEEPLTPTINYFAESLGLSRNKTFRLLYTLQERGLVEKDDFSGTYRLGYAAVELGQKIIRTANVVKHAHPVMEKLVRKHDEAVYMTVLNGEEVLFIDMVDCEQSIKASPLVGKRFPLFSNAAGKIMKALESRDVLERLGKRRDKSGEAIDVATIACELEDIRSRGVAVDFGGLGEGIVSVAVAVRDYGGKVVGALTMLVPSFRMLADRLETEIIPSLMEGGEILSAKFGYAPA
jgi:DNA-binding IclR family transcriptional regulator